MQCVSEVLASKARNAAFLFQDKNVRLFTNFEFFLFRLLLFVGYGEHLENA